MEQALPVYLEASRNNSINSGSSTTGHCAEVGRQASTLPWQCTSGYGLGSENTNAACSVCLPVISFQPHVWRSVCLDTPGTCVSARPWGSTIIRPDVSSGLCSPHSLTLKQVWYEERNRRGLFTAYSHFPELKSVLRRPLRKDR